MRQQVRFAMRMPEPDFLIDLAAAVFLSPCRWIVPVAE